MRPDELAVAHLDAWRAMQLASPELDIAFLSPEFALAVARVRPATRVAILEDAAEVAGFFAFEPGRFRIGRPLAVGVSDAQAVVHRPGVTWDWRELLRGCGLDVWTFDHLVERQLRTVGRNITRRAASVIDVSDGYEHYLAERERVSRKIVKSTLYKLRKLERDIGATAFEFHARDAETLRLLMRWKSAQYRQTGRQDRFAIDWISALVWDLYDEGKPDSPGVLSVLRAGDRVLAAHFGLRSSSTLSCWFPGYDHAVARYSPGLALHLRMAEGAAKAGLQRLDLGKGDEDYKSSLRTNEATVGEGWVDVGSAVAVAHRLQGAPGRLALNLVLSQPLLRRAARATLKLAGRLRNET